VKNLLLIIVVYISYTNGCSIFKKKVNSWRL